MMIQSLNWHCLEIIIVVGVVQAVRIVIDDVNS